MHAPGALFVGVFFTLRFTGSFVWFTAHSWRRCWGATPASAGFARSGRRGAERSLLARRLDLVFGFGSIVALQVLSLVLCMLRRDAKTANPAALRNAPYPRMLAAHIAILVGGFLQGRCTSRWPD